MVNELETSHLSTLLHQIARKELTSGENIKPNLNVFGPAFSRNARLPDLDDGRALTPGEGDGNAQREIHCDDDEPHQPLCLARRYAQHCDGERGLAPQRGENRKGPREIADQQVDFEVLEVEF